jgi:hypothetical protein
MCYNKKFLFFFVLLFISLCENNFTQEQSADEFLVGAFIAAMHPPVNWITQRQNYDQILECGFNSVFQYAIKDLGFPQTPNWKAISIQYIYATMIPVLGK